jgi:hypothetical protein
VASLALLVPFTTNSTVAGYEYHVSTLLANWYLIAKVQATVRFAWQIVSPALTQCNYVKNLFSVQMSLRGGVLLFPTKQSFVLSNISGQRRLLHGAERRSQRHNLT